ncbi:hypothetical protein PM082_012701 [Marasmius tenuissimus]|nr:hypothetical protein PM082_012701 [Marasmius tenuissimus]
MARSPDLSNFSPLPPPFTVRKRKKTVPQSTPPRSPSSEPIYISDSDSEGNSLGDINKSSSRKKIRSADEITQRSVKEPSGSSSIPGNAAASSSKSRQPSAEENLSKQDLRNLVAFNYNQVSDLSTHIANCFKGDSNAPIDLQCLELLLFVALHYAAMFLAQKSTVNTRNHELIAARRNWKVFGIEKLLTTDTLIEERLGKVFDLRKWDKTVLLALCRVLKGKDTIYVARSPCRLGIHVLLAAVGKLDESPGATLIVSQFMQPHDITLLQAKTISVEVWKNGQSTANSACRSDVIYVRPTAFSNSEQALRRLFAQKMISKILLDTSWCGLEVSKTVKMLRQHQQNVPLLLLSSNGTKSSLERLAEDFGMTDCTTYRGSLNLGKIRLSVARRTATVSHEIVRFINTGHRDQRGLVICQTRSTGEAIVRQLGNIARHLHDGTSVDERNAMLADWRSGKFFVLVLTRPSDFEGIYTSDIRFIIHPEPPPTLETYYLHACIAGGDGEPADAFLYYTCPDVKDASQTAEHRPLASYCRNESRCRRVELLSVLGEPSAKKCNRCDVCDSNELFTDRDVTAEAREAAGLIQALGSRGLPLRYCQEVFAGHRTVQVRRNKDYDLPQFNAGGNLPFDCVEQLFEDLYFLDVWRHRGSAEDWDNSIVEPGPAIPYVLEDDSFKLFVRVRDVPDFPSLTQIPQATPAPRTLQPRPRQPSPRQSSSPILPPSTLPFYRDDTDSARSSFREEVETLDRIEVEEDDDEHNLSMKIFGQMMELREKLRVGLGLVRAEDVLDDQTLQGLSLERPNDYRRFKEILKEYSGFSNTREQDQYATKKWGEYGQQFLKVCIGGQTSSTGLGQ